MTIEFLILLPVFIAIYIAMRRQSKLIFRLRLDADFNHSETRTNRNAIQVTDTRIGRISMGQNEKILTLVKDIAEGAGLLARQATGFRELDARVRKLTPEDILAALATKEQWLDTANTRVDNGIGNAQAAGQAAGEAAARNLIRECVTRAAAGKGPPLQIMPQHFVAEHLASKLPKGGG